jgi:type IV fimbrial biogenesis protein FimT
MNGMLFKRRISGFTLTELVVVMVIVGILASIGVPSLKYVTTSNRIAGEVNGLLGDMQFARSEAVKQGLTVTVCPSTNGTSCAGGSLWQDGWIVFLDSNASKQVDAGEVVLRYQPAFSGTDSFVSDTPAFTAIVFNREGYAATGAAGIVTVKLHDSTANTSWTRCLAITSVGMLTTEKVGTGNCT